MEYNIIAATTKADIKIDGKEYRVHAWIDIPEQGVTMPLILWNNFLRTPQSIEAEKENSES